MAEANGDNGKVQAALTQYQVREITERLDALAADVRAMRAEQAGASTATATTLATLCERVASHDRDITALKGESRIVGVVNAFATAIVAAYFGITGGR